jgi:hypothetical protein
MDIREQRQLNPVADEVAALIAVVRPILTATLYALKREVVKEAAAMRMSNFSCCRACTRRAMVIVGYALNMASMKPLADAIRAFLSE